MHLCASIFSMLWAFQVCFHTLPWKCSLSWFSPWQACCDAGLKANDRTGFQIANDSSIGEVAGTSSVCWPWCFLSGNRCSFWPWRLCALGCYRLLAWTLGQVMQEDNAIFCFFIAVQSIFSRCQTRTQGLTESMTFFPSTVSISRYLKLLPGYWKTWSV